jgi:hypothetical protein
VVVPDDLLDGLEVGRIPDDVDLGRRATDRVRFRLGLQSLAPGFEALLVCFGT